MPEGSSVARLYLVGEAPGRREAESGRPFVGPAGQALREMLGEAGIDASSVRLANTIPYRPIERSRTGSRNRTPSANELRTLGRYVLGDIAKVQPSFIGALGKSAAKLFGAGSVEEVRGRRFSFRGHSGRRDLSSELCAALWRQRIRALAVGCRGPRSLLEGRSERAERGRLDFEGRAFSSGVGR